MSPIRRSFGRTFVATVLALALFVPLGSAVANKERVLYSFTGGSNGANPPAGVVLDEAGNLYGTTRYGGYTGGACGGGCGTVFKLTPDGQETALYSFVGGTDGHDPEDGGLIRDAATGYLYGVTYAGGVGGYGTVFGVAANGSETVLHSFAVDGSEGKLPRSRLIQDAENNLYGTAYEGGEFNNGTVFKLASNGAAFTVLHSFGSGSGEPEAGLRKDKLGNLYGTTFGGGGGYGGIFKLAPNGTVSVLYSFMGGTDGAYPISQLAKDKLGNLYGTAYGRGAYDFGTVFKLTPDGAFTVLHTFKGGRDGALPYAGLFRSRSGNFYGTTESGGGSGNCSEGCGTVFEITPHGVLSILHRFAGGNDGANPDSVPIEDDKGNLCGTTYLGGAENSGTVFVVKE